MTDQLTFAGELGLAQSQSIATTNFALPTHTAGGLDFTAGGYSFTKSRVAWGGTFSAVSDFVFTGITDADALASMPSFFPGSPGLVLQQPSFFFVKIWDEDDNLIFQDFISKNLDGSLGKNLGQTAVQCLAGKTYTIAFDLGPGLDLTALPGGINLGLKNGAVLPFAHTTALYGAPNTTGVDSGLITGPIHWLQAVFDDAYDGDGPPSANGQAWLMSASFNLVVPSLVTTLIPPDPVVLPGGQQFTIGIRNKWMPSSVNEWTLQVSHSSDGATGWSDWTSLGTFQITDNIFTHSGLDPFDKPYYRYRYQVASASLLSPWSEITFAGQVKNFVTADTDDSGIQDILDAGNIGIGALSPSNLNVSQLSAVSADLGHVSAGVISGPLFQTSDTNPRVIMQQDVGVTATDSSGNIVFDLDAVTGALTLKGAVNTGSTISGATITGSTIQTASSGKRIVIDSNGLAGYASNGTTKVLDYNQSTGQISVSGNISGSSFTGGTISGAIISGNTIQTASTGSRVVMTSAGIVGYATDGTTQRFNLDASTGLLTLNGAVSTASGSVIDGQYISAGTIVTASLHATAIDGMTITGATVRTGIGARVEMSATNLGAYDSGGGTIWTLDAIAGLSFPGEPTAFASSTMVQWGDPVGSLEGAYISAGVDTSGGNATLYLASDMRGFPGGGGVGQVFLDAYGSDGTDEWDTQVNIAGGGGTSSWFRVDLQDITASTLTGRLLIDGNQNSDYPQLLTTAKVKTAFGYYSGTTHVLTASNGVSSVTRNGTGDYTINFAETAATGWVVVAMARGGSPALFARSNAGLSTTTARVLVGTIAATPTATDAEISFVAYSI